MSDGIVCPALRLTSIEALTKGRGELGPLEVEVEFAWRSGTMPEPMIRTLGVYKIKVGETRSVLELVVPRLAEPWVLWWLQARDLDRAADRAARALPDALGQSDIRRRLLALGVGDPAMAAVRAVIGLVLARAARPDVLAQGGGYLTPGFDTPILVPPAGFAGGVYVHLEPEGDE